MSHVLPRQALEALADRLAAQPADESEVTVVIDGTPVVVRYALRTSGSSSTKWTEIGIRPKDLVGSVVRFLIDVRPAGASETADVRAGRLRDIVVGDRAFDDMFIVEAAPEDVMRAVLTPAVCAEMLALRPSRLFSTKEFALEIDCEGWLRDVAVLERLARLVARIGSSIAPAADAAADARRGAPAPGGYRDGPLTKEAIQAERDADVAVLFEQRRMRRRRTLVIIIVALTVTLAVFGASIAAFVTFGRD